MKKIFILFFTLFFTFDVQATDVVVKSTTNRAEKNIGDYWIAEDLALGFMGMHLDTDIDYRGEYHKLREREPKLNVFMRGYTKFMKPWPKGINLLYCYYPMAYENNTAQISKEALNMRPAMPELSSLDNEWQNYDIITVASSSYAKKLNEVGIKAFYIPQFTNIEKFYPAPQDDLKTDILFVGSNWHDRISLRYAIESGFDVDVYGYNWQGIVPDEMYRAPYIDNDRLNQYYSSAKIVLNDHRPDMKQFGFINNRIYDATAAGTLVISDYMPEIEEVYGDSVPMFKTKEELAKLLSYYLAHEEERVQKAQQAREITLKYFTNNVVAQKIWDLYNEKTTSIVKK